MKLILMLIMISMLTVFAQSDSSGNWMNVIKGQGLQGKENYSREIRSPVYKDLMMGNSAAERDISEFHIRPSAMMNQKVIYLEPVYNSSAAGVRGLISMDFAKGNLWGGLDAYGDNMDDIPVDTAKSLFSAGFIHSDIGIGFRFGFDRTRSTRESENTLYTVKKRESLLWKNTGEHGGIFASASVSELTFFSSFDYYLNGNDFRRDNMPAYDPDNIFTDTVDLETRTNRTWHLQAGFKKEANSQSSNAVDLTISLKDYLNYYHENYDTLKYSTVSPDNFSKLRMQLNFGQKSASGPDYIAYWGMGVDMSYYSYEDIQFYRKDSSLFLLSFIPKISLNYQLTPNWEVLGGLSHIISFGNGGMEGRREDIYNSGAEVKTENTTQSFLYTRPTALNLGFRFEKGRLAAEGLLSNQFFKDGTSSLFTGKNMIARFGIMLNLSPER